MYPNAVLHSQGQSEEPWATSFLLLMTYCSLRAGPTLRSLGVSTSSPPDSEFRASQEALPTALKVACRLGGLSLAYLPPPPCE